MKQKYMNPAQIEARESATSKTGKKEKLIKIGMKLAMEKGIQNTSVEDITKECGFSKGTFYYYFASKDDFLLAAIIGLNTDDAYQEAAGRADLTVSGRIALYMERHAQIWRDNIGIEFCRIWSQLVIQYQNLERYHSDLSQMEALLQNAIDNGELQSGMDKQIVAKVFLTYLYGAAFEWYIGGEENDVVTLVNLFLPFVESVLKPYYK